MIGYSTTSNIAFYFSLNFEVIILFHSSWLLSGLYFEIFLLALSPLPSSHLPGALALLSLLTLPSKSSPPRLPSPPTSGGACGPTLFPELQALLSISYLTAFQGSLTGTSTCQNYAYHLFHQTSPVLFFFVKMHHTHPGAQSRNRRIISLLPTTAPYPDPEANREQACRYDHLKKSNIRSCLSIFRVSIRVTIIIQLDYQFPNWFSCFHSSPAPTHPILNHLAHCGHNTQNPIL